MELASRNRVAKALSMCLAAHHLYFWLSVAWTAEKYRQRVQFNNSASLQVRTASLS